MQLVGSMATRVALSRWDYRGRCTMFHDRQFQVVQRGVSKLIHCWDSN
jgi:hypothetical protein